MLAAFFASRFALGAFAGFMLGWIVFMPIGVWQGYSKGEKAGAASERIVHAEQLAREQAKARAARDAAQVQIDVVEREFFERDKDRQLQMTTLEQALEQEQANVPIPSAADRSSPCRCAPAVGRGVRDALQSIGRAGSRTHPAKPDAVLPGSR